MSSYTLKIFREDSDTGYLILTNGKVGALRKYPFNTNTYVLSAIDNYNGAYQIASLTSSGVYKLYTGDSLNNLTEDVSWGGTNGFRINVDDNNWTFDEINSVYLSSTSNNVLIGATGSDINKFAVLGNVSITGNLYASSLSSLTAGLTLNQYTLTSSFISSTGFLNTNINTVSSNLISLSSNVGNLNRYTLTSTFISATGNLLTAINSVSSNQLSISSNQITVSSSLNSLSSTVGNLNRFVLTANLSSVTASLTGSTIWNRTASTGKVFINNSGDNVQLGTDTGLTGIKLDVQGQVNIGNTLFLGTVGEKGIITWGGSPQNVSFGSTSSLDTVIRTQAGNMITVASGGNVGINTATPNRQFSVNGNTSITGVLSTTGGKAGLTGGLSVRGDGTNSIVEFYSGAGSQHFGIRNNGIWDVAAGTMDFTSDYSFNSSNTQRLLIRSSNGNVAIGNITPTEKLSITGNISLSGGLIKAQQNNHSVTANIFQSGQSVTYQKGSNYVIAFNDAGTMKYRYMVLTGTDSNWTYSTTAP